MKTTFRALALTAALAGFAAPAQAYPLLQLDILDGVYNSETGTIVATKSGHVTATCVLPGGA